MLLRRTLQVTTGVLSGLAVVAVLLSTGVIGPDRSGMVVSPFEPYPAPRLDLPAADGSPFSLADARGEVSLVFFGFANCPDVCPITLASWSSALASLGPEPAFRGILVTVDPERDTPEALAAWMERFHPSIVALRGTPDGVAETAARWGVHVAVRESTEHAEHPAPPGPSGPAGGVEHSAQVFVVDREGRVVRILPPALHAPALVEELEPLL
jgi:protein SCO1/2